MSMTTSPTTSPMPFRFGLQVHSPIDGMTWIETARFAEAQGFDSILLPDHFHHQYGPLTALGAAAAATTSLKVGVLVFGNDYRHPVVLAKEIATLDQISEGRVEFGLGAGWMRADYEQSGLAYDRPGIRIERMEESLEIIKKCWTGESFDFTGQHYNITGLEGHPLPFREGGPPIIIGGGGPRMLGVAATHADIVGITANLRSGEAGVDAIADLTPEAYDTKAQWVRDAAGDRLNSMELSSLTFNTTITDDREGVLATFAELFDFTPEAVAQSPALLVGSPSEISDTLRDRREKWGFNYVVVQQDGGQGLEAFSDVIRSLAGT